MSDPRTEIDGVGVFCRHTDIRDIGALESRYLLPPFSILDADRESWRERREAWGKILKMQ